MKKFLLLLAALFILMIAAVLVYNLIPPGFSVHQVATTDGRVVLSIKPNYVVNSIRAVTVTNSQRTLVSRRDVLVGRTRIIIPGNLDSGTVLTVRCDLQYDRWIAACIGTVERNLVVK